MFQIAVNTMMTKLILIFIAAGIGGLLRYGVVTGVQNLSAGNSAVGGGAVFPAGTLIVNLVGCLLIGILATGFPSGGGVEGGGVGLMGKVPEAYQIALVVGLLGGFTTFSAFSYETLRLFEGRHFGMAVAYILSSNVGGLAAALVGWKLAGKVFGI